MNVDASSEDLAARSAGFTGDDMVDPKGWLEAGHLREALRHCQGPFVEEYQALDRRATRDQTRHFHFATRAASLAAFAILVALVQAGYRAIGGIHVPWVSHVLTGLEVLGGVGAVVAVILAIWTAYHHEWLLNRYKAERLRYAKFHFLTSPDLWIPARAPRAIADLAETARKIRRHTIDDVKAWLKTDRAPRPRAIPADADLSVSAAAIRELRAYYRDTRLAAQLEYLAGKAEARSHRREIIGRTPQLLFFATAAIILVHFVLDLSLGEGAPVTAVVLVLVAVLLPALGAMLRTIFSAYEMGRNATRSTAKLRALDEMSAPIREDDEPRAILHNLWLCEYIIESDQREWLRLMIDAEWFG
jgi:hypothetical protein